MSAPETIDPRAHRVLAGVSRVRVLEFLRAHGGRLTASAVAERVGLHANTVRLHLDQLVEAGLVERTVEHRATPGRPRLLFAAAPGRLPVSGLPGQPDGGEADDREPDGYRALAGVLAGQLARHGPGAAADAVAAGRVWARSLPEPVPLPAPATAEQATEHLVRLMDRLGFAPAAPAPGDPIELHRCPFSELAAVYPDIVCGVHLGLVEAVLDDLQAPLHATRLEPFAAPGVCRTHLAPGPAPGPGPVPSTPIERAT